ncbi:MAG: hypothetical protein ACLTMP_03820 [Eggerthella lenta]
MLSKPTRTSSESVSNRTDIGNARIPQPTLFVQITEKDPARRRQLDALLATDEKLRA